MEQKQPIDKKVIEEMILKACQPGESKKLSCAAAHELSSKSGVSLREIGKICNQMEIRIFACELGCFK